MGALAPRPASVTRIRPAPIAPPAADLNAPRQDLAPPPASLTPAVAPPLDLAPVPARRQGSRPRRRRRSTSLLKQPAPVSQGPLKLARSEEPKPRVPADVQAGYDALVAGDLAAARRRYAAALAADATNVDALLGLATVEARSANPRWPPRPVTAASSSSIPATPPRKRGSPRSPTSRVPRRSRCALRTELASSPDSAALQLTLGDLYASQGRWSEAQAEYFEAHRLQPENADVAYNLAVSLDHLGQRRLAADFYRRALEARRGAGRTVRSGRGGAPARRARTLNRAMATVQATPLSQIPLGQTLLTKGIISQDQLNIALTEQKRFKTPLGKVLVTLGFVTEATIRDILSETLGQVSIDLDSTIVDPAAMALVPKDMARRYHVLPVSYDADKKLLLIAVSDPVNVVALDQIRALAREELRIEQVLARESDITIGIEHHYGFELSIDGILNEIETGEIDYQCSPPTSTSTASRSCAWWTRCSTTR